MKIVSLTKETFEQEVLKSDSMVIVDFYADWCGPCRMLRPVLEELANEKDNYKFGMVNIDDEDLLAERYDVSSIPCLIIFKDGKEVKRSIGLRSKEELERLIEV